MCYLYDETKRKTRIPSHGEISWSVYMRWALIWLGHVNRSTNSLLITGRLITSRSCCWSGLVLKGYLAGGGQLSLLHIAVTHDLEKNGEQNESQVGPSDQFPREAIEEANLIRDDRRWARFRAERARAVFNVRVSEEHAVGIHRLLALLSFRFEVYAFSRIVRLFFESNDTKTVRLWLVIRHLFV